MKNVLITGVNGQDGSLMADYLLKVTDYNIYGVIRKNSNMTNKINDKRFKLLEVDQFNKDIIDKIFLEIKPDYCINFASQNFYNDVWGNPSQTFEINAMLVLWLLDAIRNFMFKCKFIGMGSAEEFGDILYSPQDLKHPCNPKSPYSIGKYAARNLIDMYRERYNIYAIHCVLYNHEGTRRNERFITRKITKGLSKIKSDLMNNIDFEPIKVGNINIRKDWSDAEDFIEAIWLMLNQDKSRNYLLSSDETHSIKEFIDLACKYADINVEWKDDRLYSNDKIIVEIDKNLYRPIENYLLVGDSSETRKILNWQPKTSFEMLVKKMIDFDIK